MTTRSFELTDGQSDKFWTITLDRAQYTVNFGRRGTAGQTQIKEIGSLEAAQKAFDKLIAEKLKKGYKETTPPQNGKSSPKPPAPIPKSEASSEQSEPTPGPASEASSYPQPPTPDPHPTERSEQNPGPRPPAPGPASEASSEPVRLAPWDWMIATWRPRHVPQKPAPKPFDRDAAMALLHRWLDLAAKEHWWGNGWNRLELPAPMTREEARFWLHGLFLVTRVMHINNPGTPADWAKELRERTTLGLQELSNLELSSPLLPAEVDDLLRTGHPCALLLLPLLTLFPASDIAEILVESSCRSDWHDLGEDCLRERLFQYLSDSDLEVLRSAINRRLPGVTSAPVKTSLLQYPASCYIFRLAAYVGSGTELTRVVEGWPANSYSSFVRSHKPQDIIYGLPSADLMVQHMRRLRFRPYTPFHIRAWLAHTELGQLEMIGRSIAQETNRQDASELAQTFGNAVIAPEAAPIMLNLALDSKAQPVARAWLMDHPAETIAGLAPVAEGKGRAADAAIEILRDLDRAGHGPALESHLSAALLETVLSYRKTAAAAADCAVLDARSTPPGLAAAFEEAARIKSKLPSWSAFALLPPVITAAGRLNEEQTTTVLRALAHSDLAVPHPLLLALRCYATPDSLDRFVWTLFERWLAEGAPAKEKWALGAVGLYGSDQSAISLAGLIRVWPGQGKHQTAVMGLECLRAIGTNTALIQISSIAQKVKFQAIKLRARECMEAIAADLNLTRQQLEDRVVPDCGLDDHGSRVFDFGPRQFRLILGPGLKPLVADSENQRKPDLPKPNSKDDPAKADEALAAWKLVKKQVADVTKVQIRRLEQALVTQRRWTVDEFEQLFLQHPLLMNMSPWLVWGAFRGDGKPALTFRVTEDRTLADEHDKPATLPRGAAIGLVHPMHLEPASLAAWGELLSDYEILPPFPQLGRPILRLTESERHGHTLYRHAGVIIPAASLVGTLERLGWQRSAVGDGGMYDWHFKYFAELGFTAILEHEGIIIGMLADSDPTPINACYFIPGEPDRNQWGSSGSHIPLEDVDPLIISEILSDLQTLASKGKKS